jgi:pSer/pThr/pTyr-binding forkhead associated (FHA) protein
MATLVFVEEHPITGRLIELADGATVGREGCDILLADPEASRRHAVLRDDPGLGPQVEDLGSTNGTYVNDRRVDGASRLRSGDVIRFGNTVWSVFDARSARGRSSRACRSRARRGPPGRS